MKQIKDNTIVGFNTGFSPKEWSDKRFFYLYLLDNTFRKKDILTFGNKSVFIVLKKYKDTWWNRFLYLLSIIDIPSIVAL